MLHILAADSGDPVVGFIVFGLVIFFWVVSAVSSAKKNSDNQRRQLRQTRHSMSQPQQPAPMPVSAPPRRASVRLAPAIARRVPPPVITRSPFSKKITTAQRAALAKKAAAQISRPAPPPIPTKPPALPAAQQKTPSAAPTITSLERKPNTISASAIRGWLKPTTLQQQFILTELFQPPLALRDRTS